MTVNRGRIPSIRIIIPFKVSSQTVIHSLENNTPFLKLNRNETPIIIHNVAISFDVIDQIL